MGPLISNWIQIRRPNPRLWNVAAQNTWNIQAIQSIKKSNNLMQRYIYATDNYEAKLATLCTNEDNINIHMVFSFSDLLWFHFETHMKFVLCIGLCFKVFHWFWGNHMRVYILGSNMYLASNKLGAHSFITDFPGIMSQIFCTQPENRATITEQTED